LTRKQVGVVGVAPVPLATIEKGWKLPGVRLALLARVLPASFLLVGVVLFLTRLPRVLLSNLWAEDGTVFYAQAYNINGLYALLIPHTGYLQSFGRLESALAVNFPVAWAPRFATGASLLADVLPGAVFVSDRFRQVVPSRAMRVLLALATIALPGSYEVNGNLANSQWHLALLGFVLLLAAPRTRLGHLLDLVALAVVGLSGPFCLLLLPVALVLAWKRGRWLWPRIAVLAACVAAQALVYITHRGQRPASNLGASGDLLVRILDRPLLVPILGTHSYLDLVHLAVWRELWLPLATVVVGAGLLAYALWRGPLELRLLFWLATGVMIFTLFGSLALPDRTAWSVLADVTVQFRYFYIPGVVWLVTLIWAVSQTRVVPLRALALGLLVAGLLIGIPRDWQYGAQSDTGFRAAAQHFDRSPPGTVATLPIAPHPWTMTLRKRQ
jgi:hypothetical protein